MWNNILIAFGIGFGLAVLYIMIPVILSYMGIPPKYIQSYKELVEKGKIVL